MNRRNFIKHHVAGTAILAASGLVHKASAQNLPSTNPQTPDILDVDVLVVGGGSAGHVAAIQAGRMGAKTVLLERNSQLGGTTTTGGVNFPGLFHAWGKQYIAGIGWELVAKSVEIDGKELPNFSKVPKSHPQHQVRINAHLYALLAEEACLDAEVSLAYYQFPETIKETSDGWLVDVVGQGIRYQLRCRQIVDCSGGASVVGMLGFERLWSDVRQPGTQMVSFTGFDRAVVQENRALIQQMYDDNEKKNGGNKSKPAKGHINPYQYNAPTQAKGKGKGKVDKEAFKSNFRKST